MISVPSQLDLSVRRLFSQVTSSIICLCVVAGCETVSTSPHITDEGSASVEAFLDPTKWRNAAWAPGLDPEVALRNFRETVARVEPVAEQICYEQNGDDGAVNCDVLVAVNNRMDVQPNAYLGFGDASQGIIIFNVPFIATARNQDEIAFAFGHEMGHLIGEHLEKRRKQELPRAIASGALAGHSEITASNGNGRSRGFSVQRAYELEADLVGAYIAERAGYDPVLGARILESHEAGETYPASSERTAAVAAAVERIAEQRRLGLVPSPY